MKPTLFAGIFLATLSAAGAATLAVSDAVASAGNLTYNISNYGALDWAVWQKVGGSSADYNQPTNSKSGATAVSNLINLGGGTTGFRASTTSSPDWDFSFSDGTSGAGLVTDANGVFHPNTTGTSAGGFPGRDKGIGLTVTLPTTDTYRITLFVAGYNTTTKLTASLAGATAVENTTFTPLISNPKNMAIFTIDATADTANAVLNLGIINTALRNPDSGSTTPNSDGHVMISAIGVQLIPEPSSLALAALSGLFLMRRRR